jgi:hypothetical protein
MPKKKKKSRPPPTSLFYFEIYCKIPEIIFPHSRKKDVVVVNLGSIEIRNFINNKQVNSEEDTTMTKTTKTLYEEIKINFSGIHVDTCICSLLDGSRIIDVELFEKKVL